MFDFALAAVSGILVLVMLRLYRRLGDVDEEVTLLARELRAVRQQAPTLADLARKRREEPEAARVGPEPATADYGSQDPGVGVVTPERSEFESPAAEPAPGVQSHAMPPASDRGPIAAEAPAPHAEGPGEPSRAAMDFETRVGTTWTLRIGLSAIAIAVALFAQTILPQLSPVLKVVLAYAGSMGLFATGLALGRRLERFARPVMAAGLGLGFFVAFAAHFVPAMAVVSLLPALAWMAASVISILVAATRWRSQQTAGLAIFLGHVSAFVAGGTASGYSLVAIVFLSLTAAILLWRNDWLPLSLFAVTAAYGSHLLWAVTAQDSIPVDRAAVLNLVFLTSYYFIFLWSDLVWWHRRSRPSSSRGPTAQGSALSDSTVRRVLGPLNLVLFASLGSFLYAMAPGPPRPVETFYFAVGIAQIVLMFVYRIKGNPEYGLYAAAGTLLISLGFAALLDALALNLVLAAEALLLLAVAHRTRLRIFHFLAQAVLLANFVHYWGIDAPEPYTRAAFIGGLGIALAYMVYAQLEELWYEGEARGWLADTPAGGLAGSFAHRFDRSIQLAAPVLPHVHIIAGAVILVREAGEFLPSTTRIGFLAAALAILAAVAVWRRSAPMAWSHLVLQGGLALPGIVGSAASGWLLIVATAVAFSAPTALAIGSSRRIVRPTDRWVAVALSQFGLWFAMLLPTHLLMPGAAEAVAAPYWAWMAVVALLFVYVDRARALLAGSGSGPDRLASRDGIGRAQGVASVLTCVGAVPLILFLTYRLVDSAVLAASILTLWAAALLTLGRWRSGGFFVGGFTLLCAAFVGWIYDSGVPGGIADSVPAALVVGGVPLGIAVAIDRSADAGGRNAKGRMLAVCSYVAYGMAATLVSIVVFRHVPHEWAFAVLAIPAALLPALAPGFRLARGPAVGLLSLAILLVSHATVLVGTPGVAHPLVPALLPAAVAMTLERLPAWHRGLVMSFGRGLRRPLALVLLVLSVAAAMTAVYSSSWPGVRWATAGWSVAAGVTMGLGFAFRSADHRRLALAVFAISIARIFLVDVRGLSSSAQTVAFLVLGVSLVAVAWLYSRFGERIQRWL